MNDNIYFLNRIIKVISPFTFQTFKIELNGEENELRDLLATILEINPHSIKGLRDSYNNYYTLSSAVKNPHINTNPYNYYTVVIKESNSTMSNKNTSLIKSPSYNYNLLKNERIYSLPNDNSINYHNNFLNNTYNFYEDNNFNEENMNRNNLKYFKNSDVSEFLCFADDLYKKNYIDSNLVRKLKRLIKENNEEVLTLMSPFINLKSHKSYDEFTKRIMPVISSRSPIFENEDESNENSSSSSDNGKNNKNKKKEKVSKEEKILEDVKLNFPKEKFSKLKNLLKKKNKKIIKIIKNYEKNKDYNPLISKLTKLLNELEENDEFSSDNKDDSEEGKNKKSKKKNKNKNKINEKDIKKLTKNIINSLKDKGIDLYYISKFDLQRLNDEEKIALYSKKFKLPIDSIINNGNGKIPKKNINTIKNYYQDFIAKKIKKNFDENENIIYESLLEQEEENNIIIKCYKDLLKHKNINELKNQIKEIIKETVEGIEEEEGEEEEDDEEQEQENNQGKNLIKEENEEEEDDEEEEEEGEEEEDEKDNEEDENNSSEKSSENIIILKDDNKDRGTNLLNNNYRKINNYNYNNNNSSNNKNDNNDKDKNNKNEDDQKNLGLGFVVVKQKNNNKKDDSKNNELKLNLNESKQNESSISTTNQNKKLNQFIQQIEHLKKIDDIKKPIIEAINNNNRYIMDLFQKFQKNKFNLNPKSLYAVYKQIKENPDTNSKDSIFKSLIKEVPNINENIQEFLCNEFTKNKNSELETYYTLYDASKEKDEFIESIEMFMKKPATKKLLTKFSLNKIKTEVAPNLFKKNDNNDNLIEKSKEFTKILLKYNLFNEKEFNIIMNSLENDDNVFSATFQLLFNDQDLDEFYETITIALENQINKKENKK